MRVSQHQFKEQLALRKQLGTIMGENRRLYGNPPGWEGGSRGRPGIMAGYDTPEGQTGRLKEKIASTIESNRTYHLNQRHANFGEE